MSRSGHTRAVAKNDTVTGEQKNLLDLLWICGRVGGQGWLFGERVCSCGMQLCSHLGHLPERAFISLHSSSLRPPPPQAQSRIQPYQFTLCSLRSAEEVTLGVEGTSRDRHSSSTLGKQLPLSTGPDECLTAFDKSPRRVPQRILHLRQCNISKQEKSDLINALMTISYFNVINAEIAECKCTIL